MAMRERIRACHFVAQYFGGVVGANRRILRAYELGGYEAGRAAWRKRAERALEIAGGDLHVSGTEHIPDGGCVLVYNEASLLDLVLLDLVVYDHADVGVGAEVYRRIPLMAEVAEKMGIVLFQRGNREEAGLMLDRVTGWVSEGRRLAMGGEGRMSKDGGVGHFKRGGCLVAIRGAVPVVPVALAGAPEMFPFGSLRLSPGPLSVTFGEPMSTEGLTEEDAPELAQRVREEVVRLREQRKAELGIA
jgi:1-acyl-sn-glycerol-3-phosphate acyltransferase